MQLAKITLTNLRYHFPVHFLAAVLVAVLTPMANSIRALDAKAAAGPLEMFLPFIGAILLTPIFLPEQPEGILDVVRSKKTPYLLVCLIRILYSITAVLLITVAFILAMNTCESAVSWQHFAGSAVSSLFLGAVGLFTAALSGSAAAGYMACIVYYAANVGLKDKLGYAYLFSMYSGQDFSHKYFLAALSVSVIALAFCTLKWKEAR